ncbi:MAG: hypothetical protein JWN30_808 [Bacilli bacterium]|nr:hypothetical protein [Bacilli bacterium]
MLNDQLVNRILDLYGIKAKRSKQIGPVVRLVADKHIFALKQYDSLEGLAFQVAAVRHLKARKFQHCLSFVPAKNNQPIAQFQGKSYLLSKWITGRCPNVKHWSELRAMVQELARFHLASVGLEFEEQSMEHKELAAKTNWHKLPLQMEDKLQQLKLWRKDYAHPGLDKAVYLADKSLEQLHSAPCLELAEQEQAGKTFVHGDYNFPNLVLRNDNKIFLIDLDNASYHVRLADLIHVVQRNWGVNVDLARRMMREYHKIRSLRPAEFEVLTAAVSFPAQYWRMIHLARYKGKHPSAKQLDHWSHLFLSSRAAHQIRQLRMKQLV